MEIIDLFPTPIGIFKTNLDAKEKDYLLNQEFHNHRIYTDMIVSKDTNILNNQKDNISSTYDFIKDSLDAYATTTLATRNPLKFTQSWLTKHQSTEQKTFQHRHQNSIISGSFYVSATQEDTGIKFYKDDDQTQKYIKWEQDEDLIPNNRYAFAQVQFPIETGVLILFPSWLRHSVEGKFSDSLRCALAFNTWFEGQMGSEELFTLL